MSISFYLISIIIQKIIWYKMISKKQFRRINLSFSKVSLLFLVFLLSNTLLAKDPSWSIGAISNYSTSLYKETDGENKSFPLITYDSDTIFVKELGIGYHLLNGLDVSLIYKDSLFDPDDSNNNDIQQLNERDAGVLLKGNLNLGLLKIEIGQDISGNYNGHYASAAIGAPLYIGSFIAVGAVKYIYNDQKRSEHLFSVSAQESALTGGTIAAHDIDSGTTAVSYGVRFIKPLTDRFKIIAGISHLRYHSDITASPIVDKKYQNSINLIAAYAL